LEELARGLLGLIEFALVDKIDDGVGVAGEFVLLIIGTVEVALVLGSLCGVGLGSRLQRRALGLLILCEAAALVFLPATAGAGIIASGFGHDEGDERCISSCWAMRHFTGCCCASMSSLPPPSGPKAAGCAGSGWRRPTSPASRAASVSISGSASPNGCPSAARIVRAASAARRHRFASSAARSTSGPWWF